MVDRGLRRGTIVVLFFLACSVKAESRCKHSNCNVEEIRENSSRIKTESSKFNRFKRLAQTFHDEFDRIGNDIVGDNEETRGQNADEENPLVNGYRQENRTEEVQHQLTTDVDDNNVEENKTSDLYTSQTPETTTADLAATSTSPSTIEETGQSYSQTESSTSSSSSSVESTTRQETTKSTEDDCGKNFTAALEVSIIPHSQYVQVGKTTQLECKVSPPLETEDYLTTWFKKNNSESVRDPLRGENNRTLVITNAQLSETGTYYCVLAPRDGCFTGEKTGLALVAVYEKPNYNKHLLYVGALCAFLMCLCVATVVFNYKRLKKFKAEAEGTDDRETIWLL